MNADHLIGFVVEFEDGTFLEAAEALVVFGNSRKEEIGKSLSRERVQFRDLNAEQVFHSWEETGGPAFTLDRESFRAFDLLAMARSISPSGTLLFSLSREPIEGDDVFITYAAPSSRS
jgi:hypothetical protein